MPTLSVVIPTFRRHRLLARVLDLLERQTLAPSEFEVLVIDDPWEDDPDAVEAAIGNRPYPGRRLDRHAPGVAAARNCGWRQARSSIVLFLGDDILPDERLLEEHLGSHRRHPEAEVGVLGKVEWAREIRITTFMRWLERGIQFDYRRISGENAGWGRFYTANASVKRSLLDRIGGFDEGFPFSYEDLDLAKRMHDQCNFRLLYNSNARAQHLHPQDVEDWRRRLSQIAAAEHRFVRLHPDTPPYFYELFSAADRRPRGRNRIARLARWLPQQTPWLGPKVWERADLMFRQALAEPFLSAWREAQAAESTITAPSSSWAGPGAGEVRAPLSDRGSGPQSRQ